MRRSENGVRLRSRRLGLLVCVLLVGVLSSCTQSTKPGSAPSARVSTGSSATSAAAPSGSGAKSGARAPVFAIYYLWWDRQHWTSRLGLPTASTSDRLLPATLNSSGCGTVSSYPHNVETDISPGLVYDQNNPATVMNDVRLAAQAGLTGFVVNWVGSGARDQSPATTDLNRRLGYVFAAVDQLNSEGIPFKIILNYQSSARHRATAQFINDFGYFLSRYGKEKALDHSFSPLPEVVMAGTWKYTDADLAAISTAMRNRMYLLGDEKPSSWDHARDVYLDGTTYYWSSQDPLKNPKSFATLQKFATRVRSVPNPDGRPKTWLAPFTPGYNAMLLYRTSTCVPRDDGQTMRRLFAGNAASRPDGWTLISWNEITEGTYIVPLLRYGPKYVNLLSSILHARR